MDHSKRRGRALVVTVGPPLFIFAIIASSLSNFAGNHIPEAFNTAKSTVPLCGDVILFTSQRHGSNHIIERVNNCHAAKGEKYTRTFEFPDHSVPLIKRLNLTTYDSFYSYYKTQPKYSYKIMSNVFYQFYYHVDNFVKHLANEEMFTYVLLRRRNTVEVYFSHLDHLRQLRVDDLEKLTTGAEFVHKDTTVVGRKKDSLYAPTWSSAQYEQYRATLQQFYRDVQEFAAQKLLPLDEIYYEDVVLNAPEGSNGKKIYLPANKCMLRLCSRDSSDETFKNERA